jgi:hypothetical protein
MMRTFLMSFLLLVLIAGCSSNVRFIQTNETYEPEPKPKDAPIVFRHGVIDRPHYAVGIIVAELGRRARQPELDALIRKKAREIGADGVMYVEYDVEREVYVQRYHGVVGRGPWRRHVVAPHAHVEVKKTASAIAVMFK